MSKPITKYSKAEIFQTEEGFYWVGYGTAAGFYDTLEEAKAAIDSMAGER